MKIFNDSGYFDLFFLVYVSLFYYLKKVHIKDLLFMELHVTNMYIPYAFFRHLQCRKCKYKYTAIKLQQCNQCISEEKNAE